LQHQGLLQLGQRLEHQSSVPDPVAQGAAREEHPVTYQDVFESIKREMVGELARNHEGDQAGAGDPTRNGLGRHWRTGHAVAALGASVLGQDVNLHLQPRRDEIEFAGLVFADECFGAAAAGAGFLVLGHIVRDADVGEMIEPGSPRSASSRRPLRRRVVGRGRRGRLGLGDDLGDVEEMTLAGVVGKTFTTLAEDIAAKQCQGLGQFSVLFLQLVVFRRGLIEHAFELIDAALCVFDLLLGTLGLLLGDLGLLPQRGVAAKQVVEQPLAFTGIIREVWCDAHDMSYTRSFMLFQSTSADFSRFSAQPARWNRLRWRALRRSIPERSMASCAGWSSTPSWATAAGNWKEPDSSRLYQIANPSRSK